MTMKPYEAEAPYRGKPPYRTEPPYQVKPPYRTKPRERPLAVTLLPLSALFLWLLLDAGTFQTAAWEALNLCARSVIPALFPFLVVSGLLVSQGFGEWCAPLFSGLMTPLFRLPGTAGGALALGLDAGLDDASRPDRHHRR